MSRFYTVLLAISLLLGVQTLYAQHSGHVYGGHITGGQTSVNRQGGPITHSPGHVGVVPSHGRYGRIDSGHYQSNFGHDHYFHMTQYRPRYSGGYYRFGYGGYIFGYNLWPIGWGYDDPIYIVWDDSCQCYLMYNQRFPAAGVSIMMLP